jgi:hypothetical protein
MTEAKLEIKVGSVSFSGEGQGEWLSKQLDKVLAKLPELAAIQETETELIADEASEGSSGKVATQQKPKGPQPSLAAFLRICLKTHGGIEEGICADRFCG